MTVTMTTGTKYLPTTDAQGNVSFQPYVPPPPPPPAAGKLILGGYTGYADEADELAFITSLLPADKTLADVVLMDFTDGTNWSSIGGSYSTNLAAKFALWPGEVCIGLDILQGGGSTPWAGRPNIGAFEDASTNPAAVAAWRQAGTAVMARSRTAIFRLGWEPNGNWMPWGVQDQNTGLLIPGACAAYAELYALVAETLLGVCPTFRMMLSFTRGNAGPGTMIPALEPMIPPAKYVHIFGTDVYDQQWGVGQILEPAEWNYMLTQPYGINWTVSTAKQLGAALCFPEWALTPASTAPNALDSPGDDVTFVQGMTALCRIRLRLVRPPTCSPGTTGHASGRTTPRPLLPYRTRW